MNRIIRIRLTEWQTTGLTATLTGEKNVVYTLRLCASHFLQEQLPRLTHQFRRRLWDW